MKKLTLIIGAFSLVLLFLSTPIAIGLGLYDWAVNDVEGKFALWEGFKSWLIMVFLGLSIEITAYYYSE